MQILRVRITQVGGVIVDNIDAACVTSSDPRHLGRAWPRTYLEWSIEILTAIMRGCEPDGVLISACVIHCPDGINVTGRVDVTTGEIVGRVRAVSRRTRGRRRIGWRIDYAFEDRIISKGAGRGACSACAGAGGNPDVGQFAKWRAVRVRGGDRRSKAAGDSRSGVVYEHRAGIRVRHRVEEQFRVSDSSDGHPRTVVG